MLLVPSDGTDPAFAAAIHGFALAARLGVTAHALSVAERTLATSATNVGDWCGCASASASRPRHT